MRVVDFFAGLGGFTEGATMAGCTVVHAINHNPIAVATHARNHPDVQHHCEDLTRFNPGRLDRFDCLVASPACQGHSLGSGVSADSPDAARWDDSRATAWSVVDCAEVRRPRALVVENVPRFLKWKLFPTWLDALKRLDYGVRVQVVNAADFGVPQDRPRVIITALHRKEAPPVVAPMAPHVGVATVLGFDAGRWSRLSDKAPATRARAANGRTAFGERFVMPYNGSGSGLTGRDIARPIATITAADRWAVVDGDRMRMLSVDELRACMGFRQGYAVPSKREDATQALGNAIVPAVAEAAVRAVMEAA